MIGVRLMGGLGNQMFQYALATKVAQDRHTQATMDLVFFENLVDIDTPREYELDCFNVSERFLPASKRPNEGPPHNYAGLYGKSRFIKQKLTGRSWNIYREPHHNFDKQALNQSNNTYFIGYWQTEKYFADIREKLLQDFSFINAPTGKNKSLLAEINKVESVSIHVRRSDYVTNKHANKFHGTKDQNYYNSALVPILKRIKKPSLFIFSDEPEWCKQNLSFKGMSTTYVEGNKKGYEDMRLMMQCNHNIIANSSFSWWAAWLNQNPDKIVVAPKKWFNDPSVNTKDVVPKQWQQV